ncbi:hypothetical protein BGX24_006157, partial [Mortierella sp. AD032]
TMRAILDSTWIFLAIALWILAFVGGIIRPANGMVTVSCKVLPDGTTETSDSNYIRACQAMFASTAFCLVSALLSIVTAVMLFVFSVKSSWRNRKSRNNQVGGHYKLTQTLSQYRRAEKEDEEAKRLKGAGEHEEAANTGVEAEATSTANNSAATTTIDLSDGHFSDRMYRDPYTSAMPTTLPTAMSSPAPYYSPYGAGVSSNSSNNNNSPAHQNSNNNAHLAFLKKEQVKVHTQPREENERQQVQQQQQQQQQYQYQQQQQQQSWNQQQPTYGGY